VDQQYRYTLDKREDIRFRTIIRFALLLRKTLVFDPRSDITLQITHSNIVLIAQYQIALFSAHHGIAG
jgi:hypothetical protein